MASTVTAAKAIALANKQKGIAENPRGSNNNKFTDWWGVRTAWCAIFTCWVASQLGDRKLVPWSASCSAQVREWKKRGRFHDASAKPKVGDLFYLGGGWSGYSHVGFVAVTYKDGSFLSIEGNWGDRVQAVRRSRRNSNLVGFGRPDYGGSSGPAPSPAPPKERKYVVRSGDTLATIARKHGVTVRQIVVRNKLKDPDRIFVGQTLIIPAKAGGPVVRYQPFPGSAWFKRRPRSPIVTAMGRRLVASGCGRYRTGPGPQWSDADRDSYAAWQRKLGHSGSAADGWPGKNSWDRLKVPKP
jgi:LysM repeat protein